MKSQGRWGTKGAGALHGMLRGVALGGFVALGTLTAMTPAGAQQPAKIARVGILSPGPISGRMHFWEAFRQGLRELGYVEGQNIALVIRSSERSPEQLPDLAAELVRLKVDVIVASTTPAIQAAKQATRAIPIVMASSGDPVGTGLVASLARPGGNITGLSTISPDLGGKRLEILKEVVPKASRVAILLEAGNLASSLRFRETQIAAQKLGVALHALEVQQPYNLESAFAALRRERAGALLVPVVFIADRKEILGLAMRNRVPALYDTREFVEAGGLMAYGPNRPDQFRRAATFVDKILKGAKPADLPVEQPTRFEMVINMKTARSLGLTFPPSILIRADQVIQ